MFATNLDQQKGKFAFISKYKYLREILMDHKLAALGDAYVNFVYSLALSKRTGEPRGAKVDSHLLAEALKRARLRNFLPRGTDRHKQADAVEALLVYVWTQGLMTLEEGVNTLSQHEETVEAFCSLLFASKERLHL